MKTTEDILIALSHLRLNLHAKRFFHARQQQMLGLLQREFPKGAVYFDNNGTFSIRFDDEDAAKLREEQGEFTVPYIYDKVNAALLDIFRLYTTDLADGCNQTPWLYDHIINGQCNYLGVLYQAKFINSVILIEL